MKFFVFIALFFLLTNCTSTDSIDSKVSFDGKWVLDNYTYYQKQKNGNCVDFIDNGTFRKGKSTALDETKSEIIDEKSFGKMQFELRKNHTFEFKIPQEKGELKINEGTWHDVTKSPKFETENKKLLATKLKKFKLLDENGIEKTNISGAFAAAIDVYEVISVTEKELVLKMFYKSGIEGVDYPKTIMTFRK